MSSPGAWLKNESARFLLQDPAISLDGSAPFLSRRVETDAYNGCTAGAVNRNGGLSESKNNERRLNISDKTDYRRVGSLRNNQSMQPLLRQAHECESFSYEHNPMPDSFRAVLTNFKDDSIEQPRLHNAAFGAGLRGSRPGRNDSFLQGLNQKSLFESSKRASLEPSILSDVQNHSTPLHRMSSESNFPIQLSFGSDLASNGANASKTGQDKVLEENLSSAAQYVYELTDGGSRPTSRSSSVRAPDVSSACESLASNSSASEKPKTPRLNGEHKSSIGQRVNANFSAEPAVPQEFNMFGTYPEMEELSTRFSDVNINTSRNADNHAFLRNVLFNILMNYQVVSDEYCGPYSPGSRFNQNSTITTSNFLNLLAVIGKLDPNLLNSLLQFLDTNRSEIMPLLCKSAVGKTGLASSPTGQSLLSYIGSLLSMDEVKNNPELMDMIVNQGTAYAARYDSAKSLQSNGYVYSSSLSGGRPNGNRISTSYNNDYPTSPNYSRSQIHDTTASNKFSTRPATFEGDIDRAATIYRNSAVTASRNLESIRTWNGNLPMRNYNSLAFSRKVFLGGVPWDSTSEDLINAFSQFGNVTVLWPQKDGGYISHHNGADAERSVAPKGYCYLLFDNESCVQELLSKCTRDPSNGGEYFKLSSPKFKTKSIQVIPWVTSDSQFYPHGTQSPIRTKNTVFVGALHGMITAEALARIMDELFGNVIFAGLDTDKHKYPIGSGRVAFRTQESFMAAVQANFVEIKTDKFTKVIQIDPFLEDSVCNNCNVLPGVYFCRSLECFKYFCPSCWKQWHHSSVTNHKPLRRSLKLNQDRN